MITLPAPSSLPWQRATLERALALKNAGRLPHAILLADSGRRDIGDFVMQLVMLLLCDAPGDLEPCGGCEACRLLLAGTYADFGLVTLEVDEKSNKQSKNIKIEQVRELIDDLGLTHRYARLKLAAIYPAESLSRAGANALLKTLEEPAPGTLLLLVTHNAGRVPVTLRSRCQCWNLPRPRPDEALAWVAERGLETDAATRYLDFARGDPVLAVALEAQDFGSLVEEFKRNLGRFIRGDLGVVGLCRTLLKHDADDVRRLLDMTLRAYCFRACGLDAAGSAQAGADPVSARELLRLQRRAGTRLQVDENNLDFQLQLEDVLISLKRIVTRRAS